MTRTFTTAEGDRWIRLTGHMEPNPIWLPVRDIIAITRVDLRPVMPRVEDMGEFEIAGDADGAGEKGADEEGAGEAGADEKKNEGSRRRTSPEEVVRNLRAMFEAAGAEAGSVQVGRALVRPTRIGAEPEWATKIGVSDGSAWTVSEAVEDVIALMVSGELPEPAAVEIR